MFKLIPRTQLEINGFLEADLRDTNNDRWSDAEIYRAVNRALSTWDTRVLIPFVYAFTFATNEKEYSLPEYVQEPLEVQWQVSGEDFWRDLGIFDVHTATAAAKVLRLAYYPYSASGRVVYWVANGPVPTTIPTLNAAISSTTATTCTMTAVPVIGQNGYVKINAEWMAYHGPTQTETVTTLNNLERGLFGTTAATHLSGATVNWGIVTHRTDLFEQLQAQAIAHLHSLFLTNASAHEVETHQFNLRWQQQQADEYWRRYTPMRQPKMRLTRDGIGSLPGRRNSYRYEIYDGVWWVE